MGAVATASLVHRLLDLELHVVLVEGGLLLGRSSPVRPVLLGWAQSDVLVVLHLTKAGEDRIPEVAVALDGVDGENSRHNLTIK